MFLVDARAGIGAMPFIYAILRVFEGQYLSWIVTTNQHIRASSTEPNKHRARTDPCTNLHRSQ